MPTTSVQVAVRLRPLLSHEAGTSSCIQPIREDDDKKNITSVAVGRGQLQKTFTFDEVFPATTAQSVFYDHQIKPLVDTVLDKGNHATILAYGQTGAGKSFTILGSEKERGVIPRAVSQLFEKVATLPNATASVQFLELYGEEIRDLLVEKGSGKKLTIRDQDNDPQVLGATWEAATSADHALLLLDQGMSRRVTAATKMNATSSRSHCMYTLEIVQKTGQGPSTKTSKFHFVDLAGAERQKRTGATGARLQEGIDINKGLLVLGNVISALGNPKKGSMVPYRDSKLTRLLKGSLGGNHRTLMIACVSPSSVNMEESLNCLRYANRAKNIQNKIVCNVDPATRQLDTLQRQVADLAKEALRLLKQDGLQTFSLDQLESLAYGSSKKKTTKKKSSLQAELHKTTGTKPKSSLQLEAKSKSSLQQEVKPRSSLQSKITSDSSIQIEDKPKSSLQSKTTPDSSIQVEAKSKSSLQFEAKKTNSGFKSRRRRVNNLLNEMSTSSLQESSMHDDFSSSTWFEPPIKEMTLQERLQSFDESEERGTADSGPTAASTASESSVPIEISANASSSSASSTSHSEYGIKLDDDDMHESQVVIDLQRQLEQAQSTVSEMQDREETWMLKASMYLEEINNLQNLVDKHQQQQKSMSATTVEPKRGILGLQLNANWGQIRGETSPRSTATRNISSVPANTDPIPDDGDMDFAELQIKNLDLEPATPALQVKNLDLDHDLAEMEVMQLDFGAMHQPSRNGWLGKLTGRLQ